MSPSGDRCMRGGGGVAGALLPRKRAGSTDVRAQRHRRGDLLASIGDSAVPSAAELVGFLGLDPQAASPVTPAEHGRISKQGSARPARRRVARSQSAPGPVTHRMARRAAAPSCDEPTAPSRALRDRQRAAALGAHHRAPAARPAARAAQRDGRHRIDQRVAGPPELLHITGAELATGRFAHSGSISSRPGLSR